MSRHPALALLLGVVAASFAGPTALAQAPALFAAAGEADGQRERLGVRSVEVSARIVGAFAETTMTLTFHNPHPRVLEGDLFVPLPPGATVSGYALDVDGQLVDGVIVDKAKAQRVYDTEVRRSAKRIVPIDPGLVAWTRGNVFTTRVYPILARSGRTIRLRWVAPLQVDASGTFFALPLDFTDRLESGRVTISVPSPAAPPELLGDNPRGLAFDREHVVRLEVADSPLVEDIRVRLPDLDRRPVAAEVDADGATWFAIHERVVAPAAPPLDVRRIRLVWDASRSRLASDLPRELRVIRRYLATLARPVAVDLVILRGDLGPARTFELPRELDRLMAALESTPFDGGTQLTQLAPARATPVDLVLLATDGLATYGPDAPARPDAPTWILSSSQGAGHDTLARIAGDSGGLHIDLRQTTDDEAVARIGQPVWSLLGAVVESGNVEHLLPSRRAPAAGATLVSGRLRSRAATLRLEWGFPGRPAATTRRYEVRAPALRGDLLRVVWANQRLHELLAAPEHDRAAIVTLGRQHGLVTPYTSLLVLETLAQYIEHGVRPPAMLRELRQRWDAHAATPSTDGDARRAEAEAESWRIRLRYVWELERFVLERGIDMFAQWGFNREAELRARQCERLLRERTRGGLAESLAGGDADPSPRPLAAAPPTAVAAPPSSTVHVQGSRSATWTHDPTRPCSRALAAAAPRDRESVYVAFVDAAGATPYVFLDCSDGFAAAGDLAMAARALSNIAELRLDDVGHLRMLAHRLLQLDQHDAAVAVFEAVLRLRPDEPHSYRDLGLAYARRAAAQPSPRLARPDWQAAMDHLAVVLEPRWGDALWIQLPVLHEIGRYWPEASRAGVTRSPIDATLRHAVPLDVRVVMTWDTDLTDLALRVTGGPADPTPLWSPTPAAHRMIMDGADGYGPATLALREAPRGTYRFGVGFIRSRAQQLIGPVTVHVDIFTDWGRPTERRRSLTVQLSRQGDRVDLGEVRL